MDNKEIKKQLRNVIKTLKADIKLNKKDADKAYKNYKREVANVHNGVCEGLEIAIEAIKEEFDM